MSLHVVAGLSITLGLIGFSLLLIRTVIRWQEYPSEVRLLLLLALTFFYTLLVVSVDAFANANDRPPVLVVTVVSAKVFALYVLWATRGTKYRTGTRQSDGNPLEDTNKDVK